MREWQEPSSLDLFFKGSILLLLLGLVVFITAIYMTTEDDYITIETPKDWDKYNPNVCKKVAIDNMCLDYLIFIEDTKDYEAAEEKIQKYTNNDDNLGNNYGVFYLKNNSPDLKRYIENNWTTPSRYPHSNVVFERNGNRWDPN